MSHFNRVTAVTTQLQAVEATMNPKTLYRLICDLDITLDTSEEPIYPAEEHQRLAHALTSSAQTLATWRTVLAENDRRRTQPTIVSWQVAFSAFLLLLYVVAAIWAYVNQVPVTPLDALIMGATLGALWRPTYRRIRQRNEAQRLEDLYLTQARGLAKLVEHTTHSVVTSNLLPALAVLQLEPASTQPVHAAIASLCCDLLTVSHSPHPAEVIYHHYRNN